MSSSKYTKSMNELNMLASFWKHYRGVFKTILSKI